jgi:hypothetical protein
MRGVLASASSPRQLRKRVIESITPGPLIGAARAIATPTYDRAAQFRDVKAGELCLEKGKPAFGGQFVIFFFERGNPGYEYANAPTAIHIFE